MGEGEEQDKDGKIWYPRPDGDGYTYGHIPKLTDAFLPERCFPAGEIRLPIGNISMGYIHLSVEHRASRFRPLRPDEYVFQVSDGYDEIWLQTTKKALLLIKYEGRKSVVMTTTLYDGHYSIITAFPLERNHNPKKRKEVRLWRR